MKKGLLLMMLFGLLLNAQGQVSLQQYYYAGQGRPGYLAPIAGYQTPGKLYVEGRYNYEALQAFSIYAGQTFAKEGKWHYSITPMGGVVLGSLNGGSIAANIELGYKKFNFSSQPQYTFSTSDRSQSFAYAWSDLSYQLSSWLAAGVSVQNSMQAAQKSLAEKGLFAEVSYKGWAFPVYVFSPLSGDMNFVAGIRFELPLRKAKPGAVPQSGVFLPHQLSSVVLPQAETSGQPSSQTVAPSIQPAFKDSKYFVLTNAFKNKEEAIDAQSKFPEATGSKAILYASADGYKIRVTGFEGYAQAQAYLARTDLPVSKNICSILPYQVKSIVVASINN